MPSELGPTGPRGKAGLMGFKGDAGKQGDTGPQGATGPTQTLSSILTLSGNGGGATITNIAGINAIGSLSIGTNTETTTTIVGKTSANTDIVGNLRIGTTTSSSAGNLGQLLTSGGSNNPPSWTTPYISSVGASTGLLTGVPSLDGAVGVLSIGTNESFTDNVNIGRSGKTVNIKASNFNSNTLDRETAGELTIGGTTATSVSIGSANAVPINLIGELKVGATSGTLSAGATGQVLTSNGSGIAPTWQNIGLLSGSSNYVGNTISLPFATQKLIAQINFTPAVNSKYLWIVSTNIDAPSGSNDLVFMSLAYQDYVVTATTLALNFTNNQSLIGSFLQSNNSLAQWKGGGATGSTAFTLHGQFIWSSSSVSTNRSFSLWLNATGNNFNLKTYYISYIKLS
jgi:hypothetical protein